MQDRVDNRRGAPPGKCPICGSAREESFKPFCSKRCADVDLGRWLTGGYAIAGGGDDADEDGDEAKVRAASEKAPGGPRDEDG